MYEKQCVDFSTFFSFLVFAPGHKQNDG